MNAKTLSHYIAFFVGSVGIILAHFFHRHFYFRDYSILWEGAYRIYVGQVPYMDFGLPIGPASISLAAVFFKIFGSDFEVLKLASIILQISSLGLFLAILRNFQFHVASIWIGMVFFVVIHAIQAKYLWYNNCALIFEIIALWAFSVLRMRPWRSLPQSFVIPLALLCSMATFATFLSKQDYGIIACSLMGFLFVLEFRSKEHRLILAIFMATMAILALGFALAFANSPLGYWFNLGQAHQARRLEGLTLAHFFSEPKGLVAATFLACMSCAVALFFKKFDRDKLAVAIITIGLAVQCAVTNRTSGLAFLSGYYGFVFIGPLIFECFSRFDSLLVRCTGFLLALVALFMSNTQQSIAVKDIRNYFEAEGVSDFFGRRIGSASGNVPDPLIRGVDAGFPEFGRQYLFEHSWKALARLRDASKAMSAREQDGRKEGERCQVLNLTELTPLARTLDYKPCLKMPLWYHPGISLFEREQALIESLVRDKEPAIILVQKTHFLADAWYDRLIAGLETSYFKLEEFKAAAENDPVRIYLREKP